MVDFQIVLDGPYVHTLEIHKGAISIPGANTIMQLTWSFFISASIAVLNFSRSSENEERQSSFSLLAGSKLRHCCGRWESKHDNKREREHNTMGLKFFAAEYSTVI